MSANGQLVFTDVDKVTFKGVGNTSNAVIDTLTGKIGVGIDSPSANLHVVGNCYVSTRHNTNSRRSPLRGTSHHTRSSLRTLRQPSPPRGTSRWGENSALYA
jgi:hypothetical protein